MVNEALSVTARRSNRALRGLLAAAPLACATPAAAADLDGRAFSLPWALPFVGLLLAIALGPLLAPRAWEHHLGKVAAAFGLLVTVPLALAVGPAAAGSALLAVALHEYLPFVLMLLALFTVTGGLRVEGNLHGSPGTNLAILGAGTALASVIGTTGAAMLLIRPLIRANDERRHNAHVVVFFIVLVANLGGALSPLGDPPLFLGYLRGVEFLWPLRNLWAQTLLAVALVLAVFAVLDWALYRRDARFRALADPTPDAPLRLSGLPNLALIALVVAATFLSGAWRSGVATTLLGVELRLESALRDLAYLGATLASLALTPAAARRANGFTWGPILEVGKLFAALFVCLLPVAAMLRAGADGAFAPVVGLVARADGTASPSAYFWLTGGLSAVLDNAPTYLVFFELAGGDAARLMGEGARVLAAISCGAVFMGAMTYVGNAPNFMVAAVARAAGVRMPGFFGYLAWSCALLLPVFLMVAWLFFR